MTDSISLHDFSSEWSVEQLIRLRSSGLGQDDRQLVMRAYSPEYFFERLEEYGSSYVSMSSMADLMVSAAKNVEDWYETVAPYVKREEEERKKRFPTPWEKDL